MNIIGGHRLKNQVGYGNGIERTSIAESSGNLPAVHLRLRLRFPYRLGCFGLTFADGEIEVGAGGLLTHE